MVKSAFVSVRRRPQYLLSLFAGKYQLTYTTQCRICTAASRILAVTLRETKLKQSPLANAELAIMDLLWQHDRLTARQIREQLYPDETKAQHGTVQRLLQRLEDKGYVERDRSLSIHFFSAAISRQSYAGSQLESLAARLTGGSFAPLITHLVECKKLSREDLLRIRAILDSPGGERGAGMIDMLFQITLSNVCISLALAVVAVVLGATLKRPAFAHMLWLLVFVKLLTPPIVTIPVVPIPWQAETAAAARRELARQPDATVARAIGIATNAFVSAETWSAVTGRGKLWLAWTWLLGSAAVLTWSLLQVLRFSRMLGKEAVKGAADLQAVAARIASRLGLSATPTIYTISARIAPMVWCIGGRLSGRNPGRVARTDGRRATPVDPRT